MSIKKLFERAGRKKLGIVCVTIGVTALLCVAFFGLFGGGLLFTPAGGSELELEPEQPPLAAPVSADSISIPGFESLKIPPAQTSVSAYLYNPQDNACYFEISILLADTNEEIYKSKLVSPGQELYEIQLSRSMDKGVYDAVVHYSVYSMQDRSPLNGANVPFKLIVA